MKKVIRLTESDLARIVKRVLNEQVPPTGGTASNVTAISPVFRGRNVSDYISNPNMTMLTAAQLVNYFLQGKIKESYTSGTIKLEDTLKNARSQTKEALPQWLASKICGELKLDSGGNGLYPETKEGAPKIPPYTFHCTNPASTSPVQENKFMLKRLTPSEAITIANKYKIDYRPVLNQIDDKIRYVSM